MSAPEEVDDRYELRRRLDRWAHRFVDAWVAELRSPNSRDALVPSAVPERAMDFAVAMEREVESTLDELIARQKEARQ